MQKVGFSSAGRVLNRGGRWEGQSLRGNKHHPLVCLTLGRCRSLGMGVRLEGLLGAYHVGFLMPCCRVWTTQVHRGLKFWARAAKTREGISNIHPTTSNVPGCRWWGEGELGKWAWLGVGRVQHGQTSGSCVDRVWHSFTPYGARLKMGVWGYFRGWHILKDNVTALSGSDSVWHICSCVKTQGRSRRFRGSQTSPPSISPESLEKDGTRLPVLCPRRNLVPWGGRQGRRIGGHGQESQVCLSSLLCVLGKVPSVLWDSLSLSTERVVRLRELMDVKFLVANTSQM